MTKGVNPRVRKAEGAAGPPSAKKAKVTSTTVQTDRENTAFAWQEAANESDAFSRIETKEEAFRQGLQCADRVLSNLDPVIKTPPWPIDDHRSGYTELANWATRLDDIKKRDSEYRTFIGFAGVTGAGKTSAINSIIGFRDLLPSSNEAAATAVPCLIAYNDDTNPSNAFRADVTFKSEQDIRNELDEFFEFLSLREELDQALTTEETHPESSADSNNNTSLNPLHSRQLKALDRLKDLHMAEENAQDQLEMVSAVFGLGEEELKGESPDSLLGRYPDVRNLLGQTKSVVGSDPDEFADKIKPYLDSVPDKHGESGVEFAAWPLIVKVEIFVRSSVLKNGIVLVDLPGLADNVASRAAVAQNYFAKLSVTAVVAPVIRALNEQTAVTLMTENQQLCLQMDGKFNKRSFCVVLSKMDDISVETYLKQHAAEAAQNQALQQCRADLKTLNEEHKKILAERSSHKQALTAINRQRSKLKAEHAKTPEAAKPDQFEACNKRRTEEIAKGVCIERRLQLNRRQAKHLDGHVLHWCIRARNSIVDKHMQADFERRQKRLANALQGNVHDSDLYDGTIKTFPISSSAYWKVVEDSEYPVGFPAPEYTGIPALKHWLRYAAIPDREEHLDTSLNALHSLFNVMQGWSSFDLHGEQKLTKQFVSTEVLHKPLLHFRTTLHKMFNQLSREIKALDPLKNKDGTLANSKQRCTDVVKRWSSKEPSNLHSTKQMHYSTYNACVRRNGAVYLAKTKGGRVRYAWIESLCNIFYQGIVNEWNRTLGGEIPALREPTNKTIDQIWDKLIQQLEKSALVTAPQMRPLLDSKSEELNQIKHRLKDLVKDQFMRIKMGASKAHRTVGRSIAEKFDPAFQRAKKETGKGMYYRQQHILTHWAVYRGNNMFKESTEKIAAHLGDQLKSLPKEFRAITETIRSELSDLIMMLLNLDGEVQGGEDETVGVSRLPRGSKEQVQQATQRVVAEWAARWRIGIDTNIRTDSTATDIPEVYYDAEDMNDSDNAGMGDEDLRDFVSRGADDGLFS